MPIYVYEVVRKDGKPGERFEVKQRMSEAPLKKHPKTGAPVRRVMLPAYTALSRYDNAVKQISRKDPKFKVPDESVHKPITPMKP